MANYGSLIKSEFKELRPFLFISQWKDKNFNVSSAKWEAKGQSIRVLLLYSHAITTSALLFN
jgi:hypothetical protein